MTGVYGMWNIYVLGLLFLYAPSHKQWTTSQTSESANTLNDGSVASEDVVRTGEEIEFSVSSITGARLINSHFGGCIAVRGSQFQFFRFQFRF